MSPKSFGFVKTTCIHTKVTLLLPDHRRLYEDLREVAPKWMTLGVHLGVAFDRLQGFQGEASLVERCFTEVLVAWLRAGGTVEQLVNALKFPGVDQKRLANEIERDRDSELDSDYVFMKFWLLSL